MNCLAKSSHLLLIVNRVSSKNLPKMKDKKKSTFIQDMYFNLITMTTMNQSLGTLSLGKKITLRQDNWIVQIDNYFIILM